MIFPGYIAKRYLFSKKTRNVINIITGVAIVGVAVGTMALVVVLSAFNGLESLVERLYAAFDPQIKVMPASGKFFSDKDFPYQYLSEKDGVANYSKVIQDIALVKLQDQQTIATVKGVDKNFKLINGVDTMMYKGQLILKKGNINFAVPGYGVASRLNYYGSNFDHHLDLYYPNNISMASFAPQSAFTVKKVSLGGIFMVNPDFDNKYILVSLPFARHLFRKDSSLSAIELKLKPGVNMYRFQRKLQKELGAKYEVKNRFQLNALIYKTNKAEKWVTYLILTFILVIAAFNIIASLTMLIMDKTRDIWILKSMGANKSDVRRIFFIEGMMINLIGAGIGILLGITLCLLQEYVGLLRLQGGIVNFYPVKMQGGDFVYIILTVTLIGLFASWYPVRVLTRKYLSK